MNRLQSIAIPAMFFAAATSATAAEILITVQRGHEVRTFTQALIPGQAVVIDERKRIDFIAFEGCSDVDTSKLPSSVEAGLQVRIDAVQDIGTDYLLSVGVIDAEFKGTRPHEFRPGCRVNMPQTTSANFGPTPAIVPKTGKPAKVIFDSYSQPVGKPITLTLQVK